MLSRITSKMLAMIFAICLFSFTPAMVLADGNTQGGPDNGDGDEQGAVNAKDHSHQWKDESGNLNNGNNGNGHDDEGMFEESYHKHFFGRFNLTDGVADGKFIAFAFDETSGDVTDYALKNGTGEVTIFDSIQILGFEPTGVSLHGSVMLVRNASVQMIVHDNPTGMYHVVSDGTNTAVSFLLAAGMKALPLSPHVEKQTASEIDAEEDVNYADEKGYDNQQMAVSIVGQGLFGIIATDDGDMTIDATGHGIYVNVTFANDHVMFRAHPLFSNHKMNEDALLRAISEGRVAGEISLMIRNGVASYDTMEYRDMFRLQLLTAERDRIQLRLEDQEHQGRVVIVNVDSETLDSAKGELRIELDGMKVRATTNPLEVLYAEGSSPSDAVYCLVESQDANQIMVYIPSFSGQVLELTSLGPMEALLTGMGLAAVLGAVAVVGVAGIVLFRRRR